jgi:hypothetical protein
LRGLEERKRKKEEDRLRREMEVREATEALYRENSSIKNKNRYGGLHLTADSLCHQLPEPLPGPARSEVLKTRVGEHLVRDDCLDQDGKPMFSDATTYAEAHQQWESAPEIESATEGLLGVSDEGMLYRSLGAFSSWALQAQLELDDRPAPPVDAMVRARTGRYFAVSQGSLYSFDSLSGRMRLIAPLMVETTPVRAVAGLCCSNWLHQKHMEQMFALVKHGALQVVIGGRGLITDMWCHWAGSIPGTYGDSICRVNTETGKLDVVYTTHRTDSTGLIAPPLSGGPWVGESSEALPSQR